MRLCEIARAERLTKTEALTVFREIETGRGGIAALAVKKPFIRRLSRDALADRGPVLRLFRAVAVYDGSRRPDAIVSTTLDWRVAHRIGSDFPLLIGGDTQPPRIHLLRYDVSADRIVAYLPLLVNLALQALGTGAATGTIPTRDGDRVSLRHCVDFARREQEVVADLSDLRPEVLSFESHAKGKDFYHSLDDIETGTFRTGRQYLDSRRGFGTLHGSEQEWDHHAVAVRHFLRGHPETRFSETVPSVL